jgi:hypothetical protein
MVSLHFAILLLIIGNFLRDVCAAVVSAGELWSEASGAVS